jgi:predicted small integral membrane protein
MIDQVSVGVMLGGLFSVWFLFFVVEWFGLWLLKAWRI